MPIVGNSSKVGRPLPSRLTRQSDYTVVSAGLGMRKQGVNLSPPPPRSTDRLSKSWD